MLKTLNITNTHTLQYITIREVEKNQYQYFIAENFVPGNKNETHNTLQEILSRISREKHHICNKSQTSILAIQ